jgi:hypothetical protein
LDAFSISASSNSLDVTISEGEGFVEGWFCRDVTTTLTLPTNATTDIVVGYNTDAVFDPNSDPDRDAADEVIVDLQQNVDPDVPQAVAHRVETDGSGVTSTERVAPVGSLNIRGLKSPTLTDASDRKRPTAQLQSRSALSAPTNAESVVFQRAPINDEATQGTESILTLLQSGIDPAMVMRRELDGQGGAYAHQLDAPLGRFARLNANLSFEYDTLADVPNWETNSSGGNYTFNVNSRPRRLRVEHDGSSSLDFGGAQSQSLTTFQSLGPLRVVFKDLTWDGVSDEARIGLTDTDVATDVRSTGNVIYIEGGSGGGDQLNVVDNGSNNTAGIADFSRNTQTDLALEYDGSEARAVVDGEVRGSLSFSSNSDFVPFIQLFDGSNGASVIEVRQVTVEPLGGN